MSDVDSHFHQDFLLLAPKHGRDGTVANGAHVGGAAAAHHHTIRTVQSL